MRISDWSSDVCSSDLLRAWRKTRRTPRSSRPWPLRLPTLLRSLIAPLLIAERLDRIEPRGPPGGIERRQEGQRQGDHHDEGDLERVDLGRHAREKVDLRWKQFHLQQSLQPLADRLDEIGRAHV